MHMPVAKASQRRRSNGKMAKTGPVAPKVVPSRYCRVSPWLSRILAAALLVPALPLIAFWVVVIRLSSAGPGILRQRRVGLHGKTYVMYKLRTMRNDAERETGPVWTQAHDPRITPVGHILRRLHLDELPQLFNVLRGEMLLVGPRPERPEFVEVLARQIPGYLNRLCVRPGITGLAQLNLPPDSDLDSVRRKLVLDLEYIESAGLWLDLRLLICTGLRMFKLPAVRLLGLQWNVKLPQTEVGHGKSRSPKEAVRGSLLGANS